MGDVTFGGHAHATLVRILDRNEKEGDVSAEDVFFCKRMLKTVESEGGVSERQDLANIRKMGEKYPVAPAGPPSKLATKLAEMERQNAELAAQVAALVAAQAPAK